MDWQRIKERVTEEVLRQIQAEGAVETQAPAVAPDFQSDVLVVVAGPVTDKVIAMTQVLNAAGKVTVVAPAGDARLGALQACTQTVCEGNEELAARLVKDKVRVIMNDEDLNRIESGDILVCRSAGSSFAPYLKRVQAIIAEEGGLTSDAAIMGLNMGIQVIVGAREATNILKEGMLITLDTAHGRVYSGMAKVL
jgi:phosphohistidine swiveling domain-containing protein